MSNYDTRTHEAEIGDMIKLEKTQPCGKFVRGQIYEVFGWGTGMLHIKSGNDKALISDGYAVIVQKLVVIEEESEPEQLTFF